MSATIIFGGQFGSEGKGKVAHYFAVSEKARYCVRVGGSNSGHTVYRGKEKLIFRTLPTGIIEKDTVAVLPAGSYINVSILEKEMELAGVPADRLLIDENAVIISDEMQYAELQSDLRERIGSTQSGTGRAVVDRVLRKDESILAKNNKKLSKHVCDTKNILRKACDNGEGVIIEGTQGYGLSLLHSQYYPYVTGRDTSAAAFLSETGLSPFDVKNIAMVIRTFPIRVSGNSGPLPHEIDWETVRIESGKVNDMTEYTSCTNRVRRVARFDADVVKRSIIANKPNIVVLNHMDYIAEYQRNDFILKIEEEIEQKINYIGNSPIGLVEKI